MAACSKELTPVVEDNTIEEAFLTFSSERPQLEPTTRTEWNGSTIIWSTDDKIRAGYTLNGAWMSQSTAATAENPAKLYASGSVAIDPASPNVGKFSVPVGGTSFTDPKVSGDYVFYTLYPTTATSNTSAATAPLVTINVLTSQTPGAETFDSRADIMVGKTETLPLNGFPSSPITIHWSRLVAHGFLTFKDLKGVEDGETVTKIVLTAQATANLAGSEQISLVDKSFSATEGNNNKTNELTIQGTNLSFVTEEVNGVDMTNLKAWVCLMPETISSLDVDIETNRAHYTRSITGISKEFLQNCKNNLTINMSSATRTPKGDQLIEDGFYVISYGQYMMTVGDVSNSFRGYTNLNTTNPADDAIWYIEYVPSSGTYTIRSLSESLYLCGSTTDNSTSLDLANEPSKITTNFFSIEKSSETATTYKISSVGGVRSIGFNNNSNQHRFAMYKGSADQFITLDITPVTATITPRIEVTTPVQISKNALTEPTTITTIIRKFFDGAIQATSNQSWLTVSNLAAGETDVKVTVEANTGAERTAVITLSGEGIDDGQGVFDYYFTSKTWTANPDDWTSGKNGAGFSNGGIQVTDDVSGANGTSPYSFTDIEEIVVTYCTNASKGAGTIKVTVGSGTTKTLSVTKTGGTTPRTLTFTYSPKESGKVKIEVTCTTNSIYLISASIKAESIVIPVPSISVATGNASATTSTDGTTATLNGTITLNDGATIGNVTEAGFYYKLSSASDFTKVTCSSVTSLAFSYDLSSLTKDAEYTFHAYAKYTGGSEVTGDDNTFTPTQSGGGDFTPFNVWEDGFSNCTNNTATLSSLSGSTSGFTGNYSNISTTYPMDGAIRIGKASGTGSITTPVLTTISGSSVNLTVTFKAAGWNGKTAQMTLSVNKGSVTEGQTTIASESTMSTNTPSMTGTVYTFHITGADNTTKITFSTTCSIGIDDLVVTQTTN